MRNQLQNTAVAILATHGVERSEIVASCASLEAAGAQVCLIAPEPGRIRAFHQLEPADTLAVQRTSAEADASDYGGLVLPGGVASADALRTDREAVRFVRDFFAAGKPVGAIGHGPWLLVEADVVRHRGLTSWTSLRTDIVNAGGRWVDAAVYADRGLVTSRRPADRPVFYEKLVEGLLEGQYGAIPAPLPSNSYAIPLGDADAIIDIAGADSFPASDPPGSLHTT